MHFSIISDRNSTHSIHRLLPPNSDRQQDHPGISKYRYTVCKPYLQPEALARGAKEKKRSTSVNCGGWLFSELRSAREAWARDRCGHHPTPPTNSGAPTPKNNPQHHQISWYVPLIATHKRAANHATEVRSQIVSREELRQRDANPNRPLQ